jgi:drug/metabolite transporter (DMT)-like permease
MKRYANYLAGIGYASIFGFSFLVTKDALDTLDPFELLFLRFATAALIMSALVLFRVVRVDFRGKIGRPKAGGTAIRNLVLACVFQPILYFAFETFGVRDSASSTAGMVLGALPAAVAVLGTFMLKERLTGRQAASLGLSVAGVALIALWGGSMTSGEGGSLRGFLFLVGSMASATFFNIYSRKSSRSFTPIETTFAMMWTGAICFGAVALLRSLAGDGFAGGDLAVGIAVGMAGGGQGLLARAAPAWVGILYLGVLSSVVAFFLINFTLSRLKASQSVVFTNLTTIVAIAAGVLVRGEAFGAVQAIGATMIVVGVWGTNAASRLN